ncbi:MAG: transcription factor S [Candidatus Thermoplasmatota archaeon]|jgi:DNA-directed RNA polymerase subunit M|nr:transcription factor S [Candidatus Thermoplasmatota archaeon]
MVMFCPECKSLMFPSKDEPGIMVCRNSSCGYKIKADGGTNIISTPSVEKEFKIFEKDLGTLPTVDQECPECGHDKAKWFLRQTRAADEPTTRFYICAECNHRWREY